MPNYIEVVCSNGGLRVRGKLLSEEVQTIILSWYLCIKPWIRSWFDSNYTCNTMLYIMTPWYLRRRWQQYTRLKMVGKQNDSTATLGCLVTRCLLLVAYVTDIGSYKHFLWSLLLCALERACAVRNTVDILIDCVTYPCGRDVHAPNSWRFVRACLYWQSAVISCWPCVALRCLSGGRQPGPMTNPSCLHFSGTWCVCNGVFVNDYMNAYLQ